MAAWTYYNPVRVIFAPGALSRLAEHVPFERVVLVTSPGFTRRGVTERVRQSLGERLIHVLDDVKPNPDVRDIDAQAARIRDLHPDGILALGGGSSMDSAKALAKLMTQPATTSVATHFREGHTWHEATALPLITVPTTAGTGSEVTPFATVWDHQRKKKHSVTGDDLYVQTAVLDPELTLGLQDEVTVASGLDAVSHAFESIWNRNATPVSISLATASLQLSLKALPVLHEHPDDLDPRAAMQQAATLAGMAISQTRTALAHAISYPLTAGFGLPHGIACSFTLPALLRFNAQADPTDRLGRLSHALGYEDAEQCAQALADLLVRLQARDLFRTHIADREQVLQHIDDMFAPGRAENNLRPIAAADMTKILQQSLECL